MARSSIARIWFTAGMLAMTSCGSPFVTGWDREEGEPRETQGRCDELPGYSWQDGRCVRDEGGLDLDDDQARRACEEREGHVFADGVCQLPPTLTAQGSLEQELIDGQVISPIALTVSEKALITTVANSCPDFFMLEGTQVKSRTGKGIPAGQESCRLELAARRGSLTSASVIVLIRGGKGFVWYCRNARAPDPSYETVRALMEAVGKTDCVEASQELTGVSKLVMRETGLTSLEPLRGLGKLEWLDVSGNPGIADLEPLRAMQSLKWLDIRATGVTTVQHLTGLTKLEWFHPDGTPLALATRKDAGCPADTANLAAVLKTFCAGLKD